MTNFKCLKMPVIICSSCVCQCVHVYVCCNYIFKYSNYKLVCLSWRGCIVLWAILWIEASKTKDVTDRKDMEVPSSACFHLAKRLCSISTRLIKRSSRCICRAFVRCEKMHWIGARMHSLSRGIEFHACSSPNFF